MCLCVRVCVVWLFVPEPVYVFPRFAVCARARVHSLSLEDVSHVRKAAPVPGSAAAWHEAGGAAAACNDLSGFGRRAADDDASPDPASLKARVAAARTRHARACAFPLRLSEGWLLLALTNVDARVCARAQRKGPELTVAQKKLAKVDTSGMRPMSSFFGKKEKKDAPPPPPAA
jgi:hypothetical protein